MIKLGQVVRFRHGGRAGIGRVVRIFASGAIEVEPIYDRSC